MCDRRKELSLVYRVDVDDIEDNDDSYDAHDEEPVYLGTDQLTRSIGKLKDCELKIVASHYPFGKLHEEEYENRCGRTVAGHDDLADDGKGEDC